MKKEEIYISADIEADGPYPIDYSMLSLGAVAFDKTGKELGYFSVNLETLPNASQHPDTMNWWATQQEAWDICRKDLVAPDKAMKDFASWVNTFNAKPVLVGYPAAYDMMFIYSYLMKFVGSSPFSHSALDIKTMASIAMKCDYRDATKRNMPKSWHSKIPHDHVSVNDARGQGHLFFNIKGAL